MHIQPGLKIQCNHRVGTLGLLVKRVHEPEIIFLLSCWHVLDDNDKQSTVTLPDYNSSVIAEYTRSEHTACKTLDAALAKIQCPNHFILSNQIVDSDNTITQARYAKKRMELIKTGAQTRVTRSQIANIYDNYHSLTYAATLKRHTTGKHHYCDSGDSGAIWRQAGTSKGVLMHCKGGMPYNKAVGVELIKILQYFDVAVH